MPAELPPGKQAQIARMYAQGRLLKDISSELGIDRHTVGAYCAKIDNAAALAGTPAAALDADDVAVVRAIAADNVLADLKALTAGITQSHCFVQCRHCRTTNVVLVSQASAKCTRCGMWWAVNLSSADMRRQQSASEWGPVADRVEAAAQRGSRAAQRVSQAAQPVSTDGET